MNNKKYSTPLSPTNITIYVTILIYFFYNNDLSLIEVEINNNYLLTKSEVFTGKSQTVLTE